MADTAKQLLTKVTLDTQAFNAQVASIKDKLKSVQADMNAANASQKQAAKDAADAQAKLSAQMRASAQTSKIESDELYARMKKQYDDEYASLKKSYQQKLTSEKDFVEQATALNKKMYENEQVLIKGRYDAEKTLLGQIKDQVIKDEKEKQLELKKSIEMLRAQTASQKRGISMTAAPGQVGGQSIFSRLFGSYMKGGVGGLAGAVGGGVFGGEMAAYTIEAAARKFEELTEAIKRGAEEAAIEAQRQDTLRAVAGGRISDMEEFEEGMVKASRGLADASQIYQLATQAFRNNSKISAEQVTQLTDAAIKLGISVHGPQGVSQAMQALTTYFQSGRAFALSYALGLSSQERQLLSTGRRATSSAQQLQQFEQVLQVIEKEAAKVPEPLMTVSMASEKYSIALTELEHAFMQVLETSPPLIAIWESLASALRNVLSEFNKNKDTFVQGIDAAGDVLKDFIVGVLSIVQTVLLPTITRLLQAVPAAKAYMNSWDSQSHERNIESLKQTQNVIRTGNLTQLTTAEGGLAPSVQDAFLRQYRAHGDSGVEAERKVQMSLLMQQMNEEQEQLKQSQKAAEKNTDQVVALQEASEKIAQIITQNLPVNQPRRSQLSRGGITTGTDEFPLSQQDQLQIAEQKAKNAGTIQEGALAAQKQFLESQLEAEKNSLKTGKVDQETYAREVKGIYHDLYMNQLGLIQSKRDTEANALTASEQDSRKSAPKIAGFDAEAANQRVKAFQELLKQYHEVDEQSSADSAKRKMQQADVEHTTNTEHIKTQQTENESSYQSGHKSFQNYSQQKIKLLEAEKIEAVRNAGARAESEEQSQTHQADIAKQLQQQLASIQEQITKVEDEESEKRVQIEKQGYDERIAAAKEYYAQVQELSQTKQISPVAAAIGTRSAITGEIGATQDKIAFLENQIAALGTQVQGSVNPNFIKLSQELVETQKALINFQKQLEQAPTSLQVGVSQLGSLFAAMTGLFSRVGGRGFVPFTGGAEIGSAFQALRTGLGTGPGTPAALASQAVGAFQSAPALPLIGGTPGQMTPSGPSAGIDQQLSALAQGITPVVSGLSEFAETLQNSKLTVGQALGQGAAAGGAMGGALGGAASKLSGATSGIMSMLGPIGSIVGTVLGGLVSTISAVFERAARRIADDVENAIYQINLNFEEGSATLATTVQQLEQQRQQLIEQESGVKGGSTYLNEILPGLNQQIAQLIQQQQQIISTFEAQTDVLNLGPGFTDTASQIQQIITQWNQYVTAGGSVTTANQFLAQSFNALNQSTTEQLDQSYESAIQNAIQYNDLLIQRQQLVQSAAQQEMSIMDQGVLVRQQTTAQSKAFQISQIQENTDTQMQQLNEQIQVSQYQLQTQQQIFSLTGTRVDLENQLASVQEQVINLDMVRISALAQLVTSFQTGTGVVPNIIFQIAQALSTAAPGGPAVATAYGSLASQLPSILSGLSSMGPSMSASTLSSALISALPTLLNQVYNTQARYGGYNASTTTSGGT